MYNCTMGMLEFPRPSRMKGEAGLRGGTESYRFNDQFYIKTSFPKKEPVTSNRGRKLGRREHNQLPVQSPSCRLTQSTITSDRAWEEPWQGEGDSEGAKEKQPKTNSSPFTLNTCRNRPRHFFFSLKLFISVQGLYFFPFVLTQSVKTAAVDLQLR